MRLGHVFAQGMAYLRLHRQAAWVFGFMAMFHLWVFSYQPAINNPNENVRFYMTAAIVERHTYAIDEERARYGWTNDAAVKDGHAYSVKAPGTSELGVPAYAAYYYLCRVLGIPFQRTVALWLCRFFVSIVPTLLFVFMFRRFLRSRDTRPSDASLALLDATLIATFLGSLFLAYATMFVSHVQSAIVAFLAFSLLRRSRSEDKNGSAGLAIGAGLFAAGATFFEYPSAPVSVVLAMYAGVSLRLRRIPWFVLGALIPVLLIMHFQWQAFGNPLIPGHRFIEDPVFRGQHRTGLFGLTAIHAQALSVLTDPGYGLFPLTPLFLLAPVGWVLLLGRSHERLDACVAFLCFLFPVLANITFANWRGGWTVGPRHLVTVVPFVAWFAYEGLLWLASKRPNLATAFALASTLAGLFLSGIPSLWYPHIPAYFDRPLPQLFFTLISHDFAPRTVLSWVGVYGSLALLPLLAVPLWISIRLLRTAGRRWIVLAQAGIFAFILVFPAVWNPRPPTEDIRRGTRFITATWSPAGHDRVARLRASLGSHPDPSRVRQLAALLRSQYRDGEAEDVLRRFGK